MRTPAINLYLQKTISIKRLDKYLSAMRGDLDLALKLYEENMRLAEAFYTPLQCLEVCLRNALNSRLSATFGDDWITNGKPKLEEGTKLAIQKAIEDLEKGGHEPTLDNIIAELNFGFWVSLMGPLYDDTLWRQTLYRAFVAQGGKKRSLVHQRFNALRRFRNRVAHHEPIFDRPLAQLHKEIIEAISWMCRHTSAWALFHSRFDIVWTTTEN